MNIQIAGRIRHSAVNGPGVRYVLFFQGCPHACPGCQNPETWDLMAGETADTEDLIREILSTRYLDGVTLSGGEPLMQPKAALRIAQAVKKAGLSLWIYTGWTFEELVSGKAGADAATAMQEADVLVDGRFELSLLSKDCLYRGSSNQRLIDVKRSLEAGYAITI